MAGRKETRGWSRSMVVVKRSSTGTSPLAAKPVLMRLSDDHQNETGAFPIE